LQIMLQPHGLIILNDFVATVQLSNNFLGFR
jgi:hypothetical protein